MRAVFKCVGPHGISGEVLMSLKPGRTETDARKEEDFARPLAARKFKRIFGISPNAKVTVVFDRVQD